MRKGKYSQVRRRNRNKSKKMRWDRYAEAEREKERPPRIKRNGKEIIPKSIKPKV